MIADEATTSTSTFILSGSVTYVIISYILLILVKKSVNGSSSTYVSHWSDSGFFPFPCIFKAETASSASSSPSSLWFFLSPLRFPFDPHFFFSLSPSVSTSIMSELICFLPLGLAVTDVISFSFSISCFQVSTNTNTSHIGHPYLQLLLCFSSCASLGRRFSDIGVWCVDCRGR